MVLTAVPVLLLAAILGLCLPALAPPAPGILGLNVKDFGAVGDGVADDAPAFQRAIDAAQTSAGASPARGFALYVPAGVYSVHRELLIHNTHDKPPAPDRHLRLVGEGMAEVVIQAGRQMDAVLRFVGAQPGEEANGTAVPGKTTNGHQIEQLSIDANRGISGPTTNICCLTCKHVPVINLY